MTSLDDVDVATVPRDELPALLGRITELEARIRMKLAEVSAPVPATERVLTVDEALVLAAAPSRRWLLGHTAGLPFRRDISRKEVRFAEAGLRAWIGARRRP